jgi:hypothetical protein
VSGCLRYVQTKPTEKSAASDERQVPKMGSCEHGNELLVSIKGGEDFDHVSEY